MKLSAEPNACVIGSIATKMFVTHLKATFQYLLGLGSTNGAVDSNLFVTTDSEGTNGVTCLGEDGLLAGQLFQNLKETRKND